MMKQTKLDTENQKRWIHALLALVLTMAFCVRFYGIWANLPYIVYPDEPQIVNRALKLHPGDMNPHFFDWPGSLLIYGLFVCYRILFLSGNIFGSILGRPPGFIENVSTYYFIGRFVVVLFGVATIYLVYRIGLKMHDERVGLVAALFLTFSFLHVEASHHALPDIPLAFFMMLSFLYCLRIYESGQRRDYTRAGLYSGLAVALKYNGGILVIPILVAHILHKLSQKKPGVLDAMRQRGVSASTLVICIQAGLLELLGSKNLYFAFLMMGAGFIIACPYAILDFNGFWADFSGQIVHQTSGHIGAEPSGNGWLYLFRNTLKDGMGLILLTLSIAGFAYAIARISFLNVLFISLPLFYFFVVGYSKVQFSRYAVPLMPFLALMAAKLFMDGISYISGRLNLATRLRQFLALGGAMLLVLLPGWRIADYNWRISQKDTRLFASEWIEENIAKGNVIAVEAYGPPLFQLQKQKVGQYTSPAGPDDNCCGVKSQLPVFSPYMVHSIPLFDALTDEWDKIQKRQTRYVILSSYAYARYFLKTTEQNHPDVTRSRLSFYQTVRKKSTLLKAFKANELNAPGPDIEIYKITTDSAN